MMQSFASAAKLRSGGAASENFIRRRFPNQNTMPIDDRNRLPFRPHGVRLLQVATAA